MTKKEIDLLRQSLKSAENYLEFGAGYSTLLSISQNNIRHITVVESDLSFWKEQIWNKPGIKETVQTKRLKPLLIDIGPTGKWGYPLDKSRQEYWPLYSSLAFEEEIAYDLILVDGRFRVACILQACLHCPPETTIIIHDYFNRPQYFVVWPFLKLKEYADTLGVFSINKGKALDLLKEYIAIYQYLPNL